MSKYLIISLHDFHPDSREAIGKQIQFCEERGANIFSILVVPQFHHGKKLADCPESLAFLDQRNEHGDDIVLHGHFHDRLDRQGGSIFFTKFYTANESEFLDLPEEEVRKRLGEGRNFWGERKWNCGGFIAPAWLYPQEQDFILKEMGFRYTTRLGGIYALQKGEFTATQSLCYSTRAAWRVKCSLMWNAYLFRKLRKKKVIRLSLHPHDLEFVAVRQQIGAIIETALADGYQPLSYYRYATL